MFACHLRVVAYFLRPAAVARLSVRVASTQLPITYDIYLCLSLSGSLIPGARPVKRFIIRIPRNLQLLFHYRNGFTNRKVNYYPLRQRFCGSIGVALRAFECRHFCVGFARIDLLPSRVISLLLLLLLCL